MTTPDTPEPPATLDGQYMHDAAARAGVPVSERMLESFRYEGLMPRPRRAGQRGRSPVWVYPPGADAQLVRLQQWRAQTKDTGVLKVLLWIDGFPVPVEDVRTALISFLQRMDGTIEDAIKSRAEELELDPADSASRTAIIEELARTMAAKRGTASIPRKSRVSATDRSHALALLVRSIGIGEEVDGTPAEGDAVERVLGIGPSGRRYSPGDTGPWLTGPAEEIFEAGGMLSIPAMLKTMSDIPDSILGSARPAVNALIHVLPLAARMMDALEGQDHAAGFAAMEKIAESPENVMWALAAVTSMLAAGWDANLAAIVDSLQPFPELAERGRALLDLPRNELTAKLASIPARDRDRVERIVDAAIDGKLDLDE